MFIYVFVFYWLRKQQILVFYLIEGIDVISHSLDESPEENIVASSTSWESEGVGLLAS